VAEVQLPLRLSARISSMLHNIEKELDAADQAIGSKLHVIDTDNDGVISPDELATAVGYLREQMSAEELAGVLRELDVLRTEKGGIPVAELFKLGAGEGSGEGDGKESVAIHLR
jgi:LETM1 and EF-hand domain-containing protein 1